MQLFPHRFFNRGTFIFLKALVAEKPNTIFINLFKLRKFQAIGFAGFSLNTPLYQMSFTGEGLPFGN
jgi:hypothetical protein